MKLLTIPLNIHPKAGDGLCKPDQFRCQNGQCLPSLWDECDLQTECADGSDEMNCDCKFNLF